MTMHPVHCNTNGGFYSNGRRFDDLKWAEIMSVVDALKLQNNKCTVRQLAKEAKVSRGMAHKAIQYHNEGLRHPPQRETEEKVVGSRLGLELEHHIFIYDLYRTNPKRPREEYCKCMKDRYGMICSPSFITNWFKNVGPYKGTMRIASKFPNARGSNRVQSYKQEYLRMINNIDNPRRLVFIDEKPMKEIDIYARVRRNVMDGTVPYIPCNANSRNRYNIMTAVRLNKKRPCESLVFDRTADSHLFFAFVQHLLSIKFLVPGDIFICDNCSIHMNGSNKFLQEELLKVANIFLIPLPAYHPDLNPTEFVFNYLTQELRRKAARSTATTKEEFVRSMIKVLDRIPYSYVKKFYMKQKYLK